MLGIFQRKIFRNLRTIRLIIEILVRNIGFEYLDIRVNILKVISIKLAMHHKGNN